MKVVGEVQTSAGGARSLCLRAMGVGWMWIGIAMMTLAFFSLLAMLSIENVISSFPDGLSYAPEPLAPRCSCVSASVRSADWRFHRLRRGNARLAQQALGPSLVTGFTLLGVTCVGFPILMVERTAIVRIFNRDANAHIRTSLEVQHVVGSGVSRDQK